MYLPKRDELLFLAVFELPKASSTGLAASIDDAKSAAAWREWWARYLRRGSVDDRTASPAAAVPSLGGEGAWPVQQEA